MNLTLPSFRRIAVHQICSFGRTPSVHGRAHPRSFSVLSQPRIPPRASRIHQLLTQPTWWRALRNSRVIRRYSSKPSPNPTPNLGSPEPSLTYSQRFRKLGREYGWSAMGVYLTLSALDFPFCFLAVRLLGTERIGRWEHVVVETFWKVVEVPFPYIRGSKAEAQVIIPSEELVRREGGGWGVEEAEAENQSERASLWTQLALAYAIHKSFIFIRLPLTVAVTPKVVKTLRGWGWNIGKRKAKTAGKQ